MLLLYEDHAVIGRQLGQFEAVYRDEWLPRLAASADARLLWYFDRLLGPAHHVVTVFALRDGDALDRLTFDMAFGDLAELIERVNRLRYSVSGKVLRPAPWSPALPLDEIPTTATAGESVVYLENIGWPDEPLPAFSAHLGASYAEIWQWTGAKPPVELVAALHAVPPGPGQQMTMMQRVNDPMSFLANVVARLPPDHPVEQAKAQGLEHRDRFESYLLLTATWSPWR